MEGLLGGIVGQLIPLAVTAITGLASLGMVYMNRWLKARAGAEAAAVVSEVAGSVVADVGATLAKEYKAAATDGKLSKDEAVYIKNVAAARIKGQLPNAVARLAARAVGDLEGYIAGKIEEKVAGSK